MMISEIKKRDGRIVKFEQQKITDAIHKALVASDYDSKRARYLSDSVVDVLNKRFADRIPNVEDIQNIVIEVLKKKGFERVGEDYSNYRKWKEELRELKQTFGIEGKLTVNALEVLKKRYLLKNERNEIIETPEQMFRRVAKAIAEVDKKYGDDYKRSEQEFFSIMSRLEFLPNSPTLFNAGTGTRLGLSACYVLDVEDSLESIFNTLKNLALIQQSGSGVGVNFSKLRPKGDMIRSTGGTSSGPVSFMKIFDTTTETMKSGGRRRGASIGILNCNHPDIVEFITAKADGKSFQNFNLSVAITDEFMKAVKENKEYNLINPRDKSVVKRLKARYVWDLMIENAWKTGDPGMIFIDEINRHNPTPSIGRIEATNPCGEVGLLSYESCNLGSINLSKMITIKGEEPEIDWNKLERTIRIAVHFLDNVIDANNYALPEIEKATKSNRKIGLGVMSWAEFLILLKVPYDSNEAMSLAENVMEFINFKSKEASIELAKKRGKFPNFTGSVYEK